MNKNFLRWFAIGLILEIGLLHIMTAQEEYDEAAYMGYLFAANFFCSLIAAFGIYRRQAWGWALGATIAVGAMVGYAWSRTLGMPGMNVEEWFNPYGVVSLSIEGIFLLLLFLRPWKASTSESSLSARLVYFMPLTVLAVSLIGTGTYRWDMYVAQAYGHHVGSLDEVCRTPSISASELEEKYGIEVTRVATSMMGSIVDVRIKILDPDKAHLLLQDQAALLVGQQALILAPHMHSHNSTRLKKGKIFTVFFPTQRMISIGTNVSLVFGPVRLQSVIVQ